MAFWIDTFDQSYRPTILDIRKYLVPQTGALLDEFNRRLYRAYRIKATPAYYTKKNGWTIPYRLRGVTLFTLVILDETTFLVGQTQTHTAAIRIRSENELQTALTEIDNRCNDGFLEKVKSIEAARKERAKKRHSVNKDMLIPEHQRRQYLPPPGSDPEKLNKFHWIPALSPAKLRRLCASSANGMLDNELLEDVGILFYTRCQQGTEEYALLRADKLKCHNCGSILPKQEGLMLCGCGRQYTFQEYVNSFCEHRMPGGSAFHVFAEYVQKWPQAHSDSEKMILIDWMIHQCHISMSSGLRLRSILKNLIDAPQKTAEKLILELAYGNASSKA